MLPRVASTVFLRAQRMETPHFIGCRWWTPRGPKCLRGVSSSTAETSAPLRACRKKVTTSRCLARFIFASVCIFTGLGWVVKKQRGCLAGVTRIRNGHPLRHGRASWQQSVVWGGYVHMYKDWQRLETLLQTPQIGCFDRTCFLDMKHFGHVEGTLRGKKGCLCFRAKPSGWSCHKSILWDGCFLIASICNSSLGDIFLFFCSA